MNVPTNVAGALLCVLVMLTMANALQAQAPTSGISATPVVAPIPTQAQGDATVAIFNRWDSNHDRLLSPDEFAAGWQARQAALGEQRLHQQFAAMDANHDSCLDPAEYARLALIRKAGTSAPPMSAFDTKKDQCLDFKEYVNVVNYMLKHTSG